MADRGTDINVDLKATITDTVTITDTLASLKKNPKRQVFRAVLVTPNYQAIEV
jgi:hypothetical protein